MRQIWIDFRRPVSLGLQAVRLILLLLGALSLSAELFQQHRISNEKTALAWQQQNLARLEARQEPILRAAMNGHDSPEATTRANEVLRRINQPWDQLFDTMEDAVAPGINVLSVAPDTHKSAVTLKASAPNTDAALDFVERLQTSRTLTAVHLVNQEIMVDNKLHPLLFTVSAEWRIRP